MIFLKEHSITIYAVPKIACTTLKRIGYEIEYGVPWEKGRNVHRDYPSIPFVNRSGLGGVFSKRPRTKFRIAVVRDPVSRLLSCYSNKVLKGQYLGEFRRSSEDRKRDRVVLKDNPSFDEFVENLVLYRRYSDIVIRPHSERLQYYLGPDASFFTHIFDISQVSDLIVFLSKVTDLDLNHNLHANKTDKESKSSRISEQSTNLIKSFYRSDIENYGFVWGEHAPKTGILKKIIGRKIPAID